MIPPGFIQDLLARVDIVDVVGRYVQLRKAGQNHVGLCPFHNEKTPSFTVSATKQFFHCFGCGAHGSAIGFLMDQRGLDFVESVRELAQQVGLQMPEPGPAAGGREHRAPVLLEKLGTAAAFYSKQLRVSERSIAYLKGRGLSGRTAQRFCLGASPDAWRALDSAFDDYNDPLLVETGLVIESEGKRYDRFRGRIMFPIRNRRGQVIGFGARSIDGSEPKYLNSPETPVFSKGRELYGLFEAYEAIRRRGRAIVCEGYMDVIQLAQAGFEEAVAALGTAVTSHHVDALLRLVDHVVFAFDGDQAGRKAARRALEAALPLVTDTKRVAFLLLPDGEDPDSLVKSHGSQAFESELAHALPLSRFLARVLGEGKDLNTAEGQAAFLAEAKPLVGSMAASALRMQIVAELSQAARGRAEEVELFFGLGPWKRLGRGGRPNPGRKTAHDVGELKGHVLRHLLAFPELSREFDDPITTHCGTGHAEVDRQIVEVWRAAVSLSDPSSGMVQELLAESEYLPRYRALAASELAVETGVEVARRELASAFTKLELRRIDLRLQQLTEQPDPGAETLALIRDLSAERSRIKASLREAD